VGTYVGAQAVRYVQENYVDFDTAVTRVLGDTLKSLGARPVERTEEIFAALGNRWFAGSSLSRTYLRRRNFAHDPVEPWWVGGVEGCTDTPPVLESMHPLPQGLRAYYVARYKAPYIFSNRFLRGRFEIPPGFEGSSERAPLRYVSSEEFARHIERIKRHARAEYGTDFDRP
jgi:hypothetical protein